MDGGFEVVQFPDQQVFLDSVQREARVQMLKGKVQQAVHGILRGGDKAERCSAGVSCST